MLYKHFLHNLYSIEWRTCQHWNMWDIKGVRVSTVVNGTERVISPFLNRAYEQHKWSVYKERENSGASLTT